MFACSSRFSGVANRGAICKLFPGKQMNSRKALRLRAGNPHAREEIRNTKRVTGFLDDDEGCFLEGSLRGRACLFKKEKRWR
jgi:hypothetical protein